MFASLLTEKRSAAPISLKDIPGFESLFGGGPTASGVPVDEKSSLGLPVIWACVDIIARTIASLELPVYKRLSPKGKEEKPNHPLWDILYSNPNPEQTSYMWRHLTAVHQNLWGAGISEIEFDHNGNPKYLWPIPPWMVTPGRTKTGELIYKVALPTGGQKIFRASQVVVFQTLTTKPGEFMSPIRIHRESIGAAQAVKQFGARTFGQGVNPAGTLTGVKFGNEETQQSLRDKYGGYEGLGAAHRLMFLEEGMKYEAVGLPPEDAQYLETRRFDVAEHARIYHMPLHMLQETTGSTSWGTGLEELNRGFIAYTIRPNCVQWQQEFNKKLIFDKKYFTEFILDGISRANVKDRFQAYKDGWGMGMFDVDELRDMENLNPLPDGTGKQRFIPLNIGTLEKAVDGDNSKTTTSEGEDEKTKE